MKAGTMECIKRRCNWCVF